MIHRHPPLKIPGPVLVAALIFMGSTVALSSETAFSALRALDESGVLADGDRIVGMVGFYGEPEPAQWLLLTRRAAREMSMREYVVSHGRVRSHRDFRSRKNEDYPTIPLPADVMQVDSIEAHEIAAGLAGKRGIAFDTAHYQLRCREEKREPVWMISLVDRNQVSVGVLYISALSGRVLRTVWHSFDPDGGDGETRAGQCRPREVAMAPAAR